MDYRGFEDTDLIPDLPDWKNLNGEDFCIEDYLQFFISPELTIAYSAIFCPEFEENSGMVLFKDSYRKATMQEDIEKYHDGDCRSYQALNNHRHIVEFLNTPEKQATATQVEFFGQLLEKLWGYQLRAEFPHLDIFIEYSGLNVNGISDANITFWAE